ncbi:MAG TPA: hypothetical protein P5567_14410 [Kiritimatiellia bacterium]|nr:hypothetical protein [Kiritimatiellia bacterium]HRZ13634.1 hypothetical protein [Kiritimatiellia bacterium]HSA19270.1 hypothetical protein [Kiritimatiellia bacterium]
MNFRCGLGVLAVALALGVTGCEDEDYDHVPPDGQGSIILDNYSPDDIHVYIDGVETNEVKDYEDEAYDMTGGVHRVILDGKDNDRYGAWDVDVVVGQLTVVEIRTSDWNWDDYEVSIHLEEP